MTATTSLVERLGGRVYSFRALARLYYPHVKPETASRYLRRFIHGDPEMLRTLMRMGYKAHQHYLQPRHIAYIASELGTPEEFIEDTKKR